MAVESLELKISAADRRTHKGISLSRIYRNSELRVDTAGIYSLKGVRIKSACESQQNLLLYSMLSGNSVKNVKLIHVVYNEMAYALRDTVFYFGVGLIGAVNPAARAV